ncbi:MBL fold metallo-hydrolase [Segatella oris]|uniref:MBL fold metallo-hydrolase n=1 Tax=Segatella oris TaxID=28135 RepID=UPI003615A2E0
MLKFISFGSGSSGNCYYLYTETDGLIIDAGVGIRTLKKHFKNYGLHLDNVHHMLITHDHADHVKSVGSLSKDYGLDVYTTHGVHVGIEHNYFVKKKIEPTHVKIVEKGVTFKLGEFKVTPFGVPHDSSDNVGYKVCYGDVVFVLMTDIGHITPEMQPYISEAHYLVIEANHDVEMLSQGPYPQHLKMRILGPNGHLSNADCAQAIADDATPQLKKVWLCHLSEENNHPILAQKTIEDILRSHGIIAGVDFTVEVLKRKVPTGVYELL